MDFAAGVTQPENSKNEDFYNLEIPNKWKDLHMIIGIFGLYKQLLTLYDMEIRPWR